MKSLRALIIGGTGMLAGVCQTLVQRQYQVTVVARTGSRLKEMQAQWGDQILPLKVDYDRGEELQQRLEQAQDAHGPWDLAGWWIHSSAHQAPFQVAEILHRGNPTIPIWEVRSSAVADPSRGANTRSQEFDPWPGLQYHQVVLGFVVEGGESRWLTHPEICQGVIRAIDEDRDYSVVGTVEPWSARP